ncbi:cupin domain-containing protein [Streptococcus bovimastitidis]|nr:cupin domain-containing protein [Streptococcus bovimastitidis]
MKEIEQVKISYSIFVEKDNGTKVNYFLFPEFEIHENLIPKQSIQDWHQHSNIEEVIVITSGAICIEVINEKTSEIKTYNAIDGDVIRVRHSIHRLTNKSQLDAKFIVFRFVPDGCDKSSIIKNDKIDFDCKYLNE